MYWIFLGHGIGTEAIGRANLNGSNRQIPVTRGLSIPWDITLDVSDGKMYWTDADTGKIQRANLDGFNSNIETLVSGLSAPKGIALDVSDGKMYWTDADTGKIQRSNLDGSNIEDLITGLQWPNDIALDVTGGKMYWTDADTGKIQRSNLDGSNIENLITGLQWPGGIALVVEPVAARVVEEPVEEDLYRPVNAIRVEAPGTMILGGVFYNAGCLGNLNFNGVDYTWHSTKWQRRETAESPWVDVPGTQRTNEMCGFHAKLPGEYRFVGEISINGVKGKRRSANTFTVAVAKDVNGDGEVNIQDLVLVASRFGETGENAADVNGDGEVNIQDLVLVAGAFGDAAAAPAAHNLSILTPEAVQAWLSEAEQREFTDAVSRRGIAVLEHLLVALIPKETALLANYPNPFNPETWIPYQLAKPADVTLTIYAANGQVVRTLALGHQPAGMYQSRNRAAYWDGRNAVGEPVASGLYFYTLTAGDYTATRKMLIRK